MGKKVKTVKKQKYTMYDFLGGEKIGGINHQTTDLDNLLAELREQLEDNVGAGLSGSILIEWK